MQLLFWTFFPDEALPLLIAFAGLALIFGATDLAFGLFATAVLMAILGPLVEAGVSSLDPLWQHVLLAIVVVVILHALIIAILGRITAAHLAALLIHDLILLPFRFFGWILGRIFSR